MGDVLKIENLNVSFDAYAGRVHAVRGVSLTVGSGEIVALVGESGCGKSVTAQSVLALNPPEYSHVDADRLMLAGEDILTATEKQMQSIRRRLAGMVFQDPMTCLNPTMKVGKQVTEALHRSGDLSRAECEAEAVRLLGLVQIPEPERRAQQYPHQYSGGMRQRAMIAMAIARKPRLIIADEPTTALDVTTQFQVLLLLRQLSAETGAAVLLITHDLSVVAALAARVAVMYAGKIVEEGSVDSIFKNAAHPYTQGLIKSLPTPGSSERLFSIPGAPPDLYSPPAGCSFMPRCSKAMRVCEKQPANHTAGEKHTACCWRLHPNFVER